MDCTALAGRRTFFAAWEEDDDDDDEEEEEEEDADGDDDNDGAGDGGDIHGVLGRGAEQGMTIVHQTIRRKP